MLHDEQMKFIILFEVAITKMIKKNGLVADSNDSRLLLSSSWLEGKKNEHESNKSNLEIELIKSKALSHYELADRITLP